jgi:hypothetical protein
LFVGRGRATTRNGGCLEDNYWDRPDVVSSASERERKLAEKKRRQDAEAESKRRREEEEAKSKRLREVAEIKRLREEAEIKRLREEEAEIKRLQEALQEAAKEFVLDPEEKCRQDEEREEEAEIKRLQKKRKKELDDADVSRGNTKKIVKTEIE